VRAGKRERNPFRDLVLANTRNFTIHTTTSGLRVLVKEVGSIPGVNVTLWYQAGGGHRPRGRSGLAHFLEHMVFKGTDSFRKGDIDLICDRNGGSNNAYTDLDHTYYVFNFARDRWEIALEILASQMSGCHFPTDEFEAERQVVIQERMLSEDDPGFLLEEAALRTALPDSPYSRGVIGTLEDLQGMSREEMTGFYRRYYRPDNALLVITGDVDTQRALAAVDRRFPGGPSAASTVPDDLPDETAEPGRPAAAGGGRILLRLPAQLPEVKINFQAPAVGHPDSYVLLVLNNLLSYGKSSRIYRQVIQRDQLATEAWFSYLPCRMPFLMEICGQARPGIDPQQLESALLEEIGRLCRERVDDEEIQRARWQIWMNMLLAGQSLEDQSYLLGRTVMVGGLGFLDHFFTRLDEVDGERIIETARRLFDPRGQTVARLEPDSSGGEDGDDGAREEEEDE
jgi:zinc protease